MFLVAPATRYLERLTLVGEREPFLSREERAAMQCALDLLSLVSTDDPFEHCPPCVFNEVIVDRVVSSEHSIDQRPVERVDKDFQIEIGKKFSLINSALQGGLRRLSSRL
jgi:hypothetical protein